MTIQSTFKFLGVTVLAFVVVLVLFLVGLVQLLRNRTGSCWTSTHCLYFTGLVLLTFVGLVVIQYGLAVSNVATRYYGRPPPGEFIIRLFCHLVAFCPYCISTGLMMSICWSRRTGNRAAVSMEMTPPVEEMDYDDITADVTTEHDLTAAH